MPCYVYVHSYFQYNYDCIRGLNTLFYVLLARFHLKTLQHYKSIGLWLVLWACKSKRYLYVFS